MKVHNNHLSTRICKQIFDWLKLLYWYSFLQNRFRVKNLFILFMSPFLFLLTFYLSLLRLLFILF